MSLRVGVYRSYKGGGLKTMFNKRGKGSKLQIFFRCHNCIIPINYAVHTCTQIYNTFISAGCVSYFVVR